jgi:hypothetical protein
MHNSLLERLARGNARFGAMLDDAQQALRGEKLFGVPQIRELSALLSEMAPIWAEAPDLRRTHPELHDQLNLYKLHLQDLSVMLHRLRSMLLAQRAQMETQRAQVAAVSQWATALQQTCAPIPRGHTPGGPGVL